MRRFLFALTILGFGSIWMVQAQTPATGMAGEVKQAYNTIKHNLVRSAEKMPEENYGFKPMPDMRSFAEVMDHVSDSQMRACSGLLGDGKTPNAAGKTSKADVTAALNDAFAECDKAYDALTDANASEMIKAGRAQRTRMGALVGNYSHDNEQYGILTVYLRLKGVLPPSSEPRK